MTKKTIFISAIFAIVMMFGLTSIVSAAGSEVVLGADTSMPIYLSGTTTASDLVGSSGGSVTTMAVGTDSITLTLGATSDITFTSAKGYYISADCTDGATYTAGTPSTMRVVYDADCTTVVLTVENVVESIAVTPATASVVAGSTQQFVATATYIDDTTAAITTSATWSSASTSAATIGASTGLATGVAAGSSVITASYTDSVNGALTNTATLTVTAAPVGGVSSGGGSSASTSSTTPTTVSSTSGTASGTINASAGGSVATSIGYSTAQVVIPADALPASGEVSVQSVAKSSVAAPIAGSGSFLISGLIFNFKVDGKSATFKKPVAMTFKYNDLQIEGVDESLLRLFRLNETNNTWEMVESTVNTATNIVTANVDHFTVFAIMVSTAAGTNTSQTITTTKTDTSLGQMATDAQTVMSGDVNQIIAAMGVARDLSAEANYNTSIVAKITEGAGVTAQVRSIINNFVTYGTPSTKVLGAGERGGIVNSFRAAFGKLPTTEEDWNDVIKIGNGRWPNQRNTSAENLAAASFKKIYLRDAERSNSHDDAAVTVMAYGLRPANRNLDSEKAAINTFKNIYKYAPTSAMDWDTVRAIAYSGATR